MQKYELEMLGARIAEYRTDMINCSVRGVRGIVLDCTGRDRQHKDEKLYYLVLKLLAYNRGLNI